MRRVRVFLQINPISTLPGASPGEHSSGPSAASHSRSRSVTPLPFEFRPRGSAGIAGAHAYTPREDSAALPALLRGVFFACAVFSPRWLAGALPRATAPPYGPPRTPRTPSHPHVPSGQLVSQSQLWLTLNGQHCRLSLPCWLDFAALPPLLLVLLGAAGAAGSDTWGGVGAGGGAGGDADGGGCWWC